MYTQISCENELLSYMQGMEFRKEFALNTLYIISLKKSHFMSLCNKNIEIISMDNCIHQPYTYLAHTYRMSQNYFPDGSSVM